jgi:hypothetical protein
LIASPIRVTVVGDGDDSLTRHPVGQRLLVGVPVADGDRVVSVPKVAVSA